MVVCIDGSSWICEAKVTTEWLTERHSFCSQNGFLLPPEIADKYQNLLISHHAHRISFCCHIRSQGRRSKLPTQGKYDRRGKSQVKKRQWFSSADNHFYEAYLWWDMILILCFCLKSINDNHKITADPPFSGFVGNVGQSRVSLPLIHHWQPRESEETRAQGPVRWEW